MEQSMEPYIQKYNINNWNIKAIHKVQLQWSYKNLDSEHFATRLLAAEQVAEKPEQPPSTN